MSRNYWDDGVRRDDLVATALGERPADRVIRGGRLVDVHTGEIRAADVAVTGTRIAAVGDVAQCVGDGTEIVEADGRFLVPGLIDCHLHIGASALTMTELARLVVPLGTAAIVTDFYEPAGMVGTQAMRFFLDEAAQTPLKTYLSPFWLTVMNGGGRAGVTSAEFEAALEWPECLELREWGVSSELHGDAPTRSAARRARELGLRLCGHLPDMPEPALQASVAAGTSSDHEARTAEQALERVRLGVAVQIRFSSGLRHDLHDILRAITEYHADPRMFMFSSDELDVDDIADLGHIDHRVRTAIGLGVAPVDAIRMGSLNAAEYLGVTGDLGSVTPGRLAFVNLVDDLADFRISTVVAGGQIAGDAGRYAGAPLAPVEFPPEFSGTVRLDRPRTADDFRIAAPADTASATVRVIGDRDPLGRELTAALPVRDGAIVPDPARDIAKIAVVERHEASGAMTVGFLQGYGLQRGAFGSSFHPGPVDIAVVGADDADMALVANRIAELDGGFVAALDGEILAEVALPLLGYLSAAPAEVVVDGFRTVRRALAEQLGCRVPGVYTALGYICLPVSPGLHITAGGLMLIPARDALPAEDPRVPLLVG